MCLDSKDVRDTIMRNARRLKGLSAPWANIYINKDLSPVLVQENKRLREKKKRLSSSDDMKDKDVRIEKGRLKVDDEVIDQSIFIDWLVKLKSVVICFLVAQEYQWIEYQWGMKNVLVYL